MQRRNRALCAVLSLLLATSCGTSAPADEEAIGEFYEQYVELQLDGEVLEKMPRLYLSDVLREQMELDFNEEAAKNSWTGSMYDLRVTFIWNHSRYPHPGHCGNSYVIDANEIWVTLPYNQDEWKEAVVSYMSDWSGGRTHRPGFYVTTEFVENMEADYLGVQRCMDVDGTFEDLVFIFDWNNNHPGSFIAPNAIRLIWQVIGQHEFVHQLLYANTLPDENHESPFFRKCVSEVAHWCEGL